MSQEPKIITEQDAEKLSYPAIFFPAEEGGFIASFPNFPENPTDGDTLEEAKAAAAELLSLFLVYHGLDPAENPPAPIDEVREALQGEQAYVEPVFPDMIAFRAYSFAERWHQGLKLESLLVSDDKELDPKEVMQETYQAFIYEDQGITVGVVPVLGLVELADNKEQLIKMLVDTVSDMLAFNACEDEAYPIQPKGELTPPGGKQGEFVSIRPDEALFMRYLAEWQEADEDEEWDDEDEE